MPRATVTGSITMDGDQIELNGSGFVSKNVANIAFHKLGNCFHHCKFITPDVTLTLCKVETSKHYGRVPYNWGYLVLDGKLTSVTTTTDVKWLKEGHYDPDTKYTLPSQVSYSWSGKTLEGKDFDAKIIADHKPESLLCRIDVLGHVPPFFRVLLERLIAKPYFYQYYEDLEASITIDGETRTVQGKCLHELHLVNPPTA